MVEVKRRDWEAKVLHLRNGKEKYIPAHYECHYYWNGKEIAYYCNNNGADVLYLKTAYIVHDFKDTIYNRALNGEYKEAYTELFAMLNVDKTSKLSEYLTM